MITEKVDLGAGDDEVATRAGAQKPGLLTSGPYVPPCTVSMDLEENKTRSSALQGHVHPSFHPQIPNLFVK